ncbi:MAG TPA: hypothetical protein VGH98_00140 [Gemmatimonadaceae bacterium]|jgi:MFS family permease
MASPLWEDLRALVAENVSALAVTVIIWTFGEMVFSPVGAAYIADIAPVDLRGRYQAAWAFTFSLGLMPAPIGGTLLYSVAPSVLWVICLGVCVAAGSWRAPGYWSEGRDGASSRRPVR